jgi:MYXO-CTERM domain-containing protein
MRSVSMILVPTAIAAGLAAANAAGQVITQWTFDDSSLNASTGSGTALNVGGTSSAFATGNGGGFGWNTSAYRAQETGSGTAGVSFFTSTVGFLDIQFSFDHRASGTGSRWAQIDYTLDGGANWVTGFWNNGGGLAPHDAFYSFSVDFSGVSGASDNADFGIRIVSIFSPLAFNQNASLSYAANTAYMRANAQATYEGTPGVGTGNYGTSGTWRFDNVTFSGAVIPAPGAVALLALGGLAGSRRRR